MSTLPGYELPVFNLPALVMYNTATLAPRPSKNFQQIAELGKLKNFETAFDAAFSTVFFATNRFLIEHMLRFGRLLAKNDYEALMIIGVLAHQGVAHLMPPGSLPSAILSARGRAVEDESQIKPLRIRDITSITGVPRETTRRKLAQLEVQHFVRKVPAGWIASTDRIEPELRDFTRESVTRLIAVADEIMTALRDADARATAGGTIKLPR